MSILSPQPDAGATTFIARLARLFRQHPNQWIDGRELAHVAGAYAWRSRVSQLRRAPWNFDIRNRQLRVTTAAGRFIASEYKLVTDTAGHTRPAA